MHLHPTQNPLPAYQPVEVWVLTSFPAHDLEGVSHEPPPVPPARESSGSAAAIYSFHSREIRGLLLPFAARILLYAHLAAA